MPINFGQYQRRFVLFDGASGTSSTYTTPAQYVGDYTYMTVSWHTKTGTASRLTLQGSNEDGFRTSITTWSDLTAITANGTYTVDVGFRWLRGLRWSAESLAITQMYGRS